MREKSLIIKNFYSYSALSILLTVFSSQLFASEASDRISPRSDIKISMAINKPSPAVDKLSLSFLNNNMKESKINTNLYAKGSTWVLQNKTQNGLYVTETWENTETCQRITRTCYGSCRAIQ